MKVSVIMGVYNHNSDTSNLVRAVSSILNQSLTDFEFLINDDGSSYSVITTLDDIEKQDSRVHIMREGSRFTLPQKLNWCLSFAQGQYIARMDDDDYSLPERLEKQVDYLDKHPDIAFVGCNVLQKRDGKHVNSRVLPEYPIKEDFRFVQPFIHPTLVFRKTALAEVNGYSEGLRQVLCEDFDLLLRLYEKGFKGCNLQENLFEYSLKSAGNGNRKYWHRINECVTRYQRFRDLGMLPRSFFYVIKPLIVGLMPEKLIETLKDKYYGE